MIPLGVLAAATPRSAVPPGAQDPLWAFVEVLLNMGGPQGSILYPDPAGRHVWTASGNGPVIDTSLGFAAARFNELSRISSPSSPGFGLGTDDFTAEAWVRLGAISADRAMFNVGLPGGFSFGFTSGKPFAGPNNVSYGVVGDSPIALNTMTHVEYSRSAGVGRMFVGGVLVKSASDTVNYVEGVGTVGAGTSTNGSSYVGNLGGAGSGAAFMRAFRLTKGVARHADSATFTPPDVPFPATGPA